MVLVWCSHLSKNFSQFVIIHTFELLWPSCFIHSGAISDSPPIFPRPGGLIFQCHIFLTFFVVHEVLMASILGWFAIPSSSGSRFVRTLFYDPSVLGNLHSMAYSFIELCKPIHHNKVMIHEGEKHHMIQQIPLLGINLEETKTEKDTCSPKFTAAPFAIARTQKQPRCPLTDEWIKKLWYIYIMEYYLAIKRNTPESVLIRWMIIRWIIIQSEVSQKKKNKCCTLAHIYGI